MAAAAAAMQNYLNTVIGITDAPGANTDA